LFSGSACFAIVAKLMGKNVIINDLLQSSAAYAKAYVEADFSLEEEQKRFLLNNSNKNASTFVQDNFTNRFTQDECKFLDNYYANIKAIIGLHANEAIDVSAIPLEAYIAFAAIQLFILDRCYIGGRLNNGQVLAELHHRLNHKRNMGYSMRFSKMRWPVFKNNSINTKAFSCDAITFLQEAEIIDYGADLIYIDPPYGGEQSDYANMFSFFESYIVQKTPEEWDHIGDEMSYFVNKKQYEAHFIKLIEATRDKSALVVSYNDSSWANIDKVKDILCSFRQSVKIHEVNYEYKYRDIKNKSGIEYVIIANNSSTTLG
jgi:adenine-specific DNA methylase